MQNVALGPGNLKVFRAPAGGVGAQPRRRLGSVGRPEAIGRAIGQEMNARA